MDLRLQAITLRPEPTPSKGFFRLPWELRQHIYELSLVELPRWEKIHKADCNLIATDLYSCERPPFVDKDLIYSTLDSCNCAKRHSLNVLLANRQVYREAAPVLWSRNVFCFHRADHFVNDVSKKLRPAHRLMLRHVSILMYTNDSVPNQNETSFNQTYTSNMWDTILQCNSLRTLEVSHVLCGKQVDHFKCLRRKLPQLEAFRLTTLMAYRVWPRRDQSEPDGRRPWTLDGVPTSNVLPPGEGTAGDNNGNDNSTPAAEDTFIPFHDVAPTPPPPPPAEHYLVLNPNLAGYDYCCIRDVTRTLWFKTGLEIDIDTLCDALATGPDAYTELLRNYRTNFLVHVRFELARLPEAWARDHPPAQPYQPLPRRAIDQYVSSGSESDNTRMSAWNPMHGACLHNPEAIRLVSARIPEHMRDVPIHQTVTLRDGRSLSVQIMGLPVSKAFRIQRFRERQRIVHQAHAAGKLTAREAAVEKLVQERRTAKAATLQQHATRDVAREMADRCRRNTNREATRKTEARVARAEAQARAAERREEVLAQRQAARKRVSSSSSHMDGSGSGNGNGNDPSGDQDGDTPRGNNHHHRHNDDNDDSESSGNESDTEEDDRASRRPRQKQAKARGAKKGSKNRKQGRAVGAKASRHPARAEIAHWMRSGNLSD